MIARQYAYFKLQRLAGSRCEFFYRECLALEKASVATLAVLRDRRLAEVLGHAVSSVPFYRERVGNVRGPQLGEFPVLTKADVMLHLDELMSPGLRDAYRSGRKPLTYSWVEVKTGGSTGVPTTVVHDREFRDRGRACRAFSQHLCGFPVGTPYFRLWGSMEDLHRQRASLRHRLVSMLLGEVPFNAFRMDEQHMREYLAAMDESAINHMMAYVDAASILADFARRSELRVRPLESIMACAGTVTDEARRLLSDVFGARVHNKYGSRECADMACECPEGGMHIFSHQVLLEAVDANNKPVPPGIPGRLLVTLLGNLACPLIRYDIGDVAALDTAMCRCGRPFPLLGRLEGRTAGFLTGAAGQYVSPVCIRHLVGVVHNPGFIQRFQLVQETALDFELKLETARDASPEAFRRVSTAIESDLREVLGAECRIRTIRVDRIPEADSGKFLYTINRNLRSE